MIALGAALRAEQARQHARAETERAARHAVASAVAVETNAIERVAVKVTRLVRASRDRPARTSAVASRRPTDR